MRNRKPPLRLFMLTQLVIWLAGCGSSEQKQEVSDATAQATRLSVVAISLEGGGAPPAACDPNVNPFEESSYRDKDVIWCGGGWAQRISPEGVIDLHQGCFEHYSEDFDALIRAECRTYSRRSMPLSETDWLIAKKRILSASPEKLRSAHCSDRGIECPSDVDSRSLTLGIDEKTYTVSWPSGARGLSGDLEAITAELRRLGFYL